MMLLGGAPLDGERHIEWNFVSSSKERIERAKDDWRSGRFRGCPATRWSSSRCPKAGRFRARLRPRPSSRQLCASPTRSPVTIQPPLTSQRRRPPRLLTVAVCALLASPVLAEDASKKPAPTPGAFTIEAFRLESGVVLPRAVVIYGTYGKLNAAKNNAVLLLAHYMVRATATTGSSARAAR